MKTTLADIAIYTVLALMAVGIAFALTDAIFGAEHVTYWLADLIG